MTVVRINAITVPAESGDELARRFAARAGAVDSQDGFEGFELLKPTDGRTTWLVVTRWRDQESFEAWQNSTAFSHAHRSAAAQSQPSREHPAPPEGHPRAPAGGQPGTPADHPHARAGVQPGTPVGTSSELWSFDIVTGSPGQSA
ncbi:MAG TPA: antibiotic biosynthesis monooxygenase family protein [Streptosporangiaceae bacterium]|nr:antibiotic biosynthesis monooxygenase family protein [Streptosporangiaceae bacterium]